MTSLIDAIIKAPYEERFWNGGKLSLLYLKTDFDDNAYTMYDRSFAIAKYRDSYKPYTGRMGTNIAKKIEEDVMEFTCCCYIEPSQQIMIEYNHNGAKPNDIVKYFSSFLPSVKGTNWGICLEPISTENGLTQIQNAKKINSIEFKIDCTKTLPKFSSPTFLSNFLSKTVESHQEFGANTAIIKFGNGRKRLEIIKSKELINLVTLLDIESEIISEVNVIYTDSNNEKKEINLKNDNILKYKILEGKEDVTGYEFIVSEMEAAYIINGRPGSTAFEHYSALHNIQLPTITTHAIIENGIEIQAKSGKKRVVQ